jgi:16S rRNA G966 N2-methylase RsmD
VRIIAGSRKGARIFAPKGRDTRPTADRVREAAFNLLGPGAAEDATVLDLFAGSGAMGLEALSRGALHATFVENDREACRTINRNLDKLGLDDATVLCQDALTAPPRRRAGRHPLRSRAARPALPAVFFPAKRHDSPLARHPRAQRHPARWRRAQTRNRSCRCRSGRPAATERLA